MVAPVSYRRAVILIIALLAAGIGGCAQQQPTTTVAKNYSFWPAAPDVPRVQYLTSFNTSADVNPDRNKFDEMLYGKASELGITKPYGLAMWNGRIYVTDLRAKGVVVLDLRKRETRVMGLGGSQEVEKAIDVTIGPDGTKYVIDSNKNAIFVFDPDERFVRMFTMADFNPVGVAIYQNELFVSDFKGACVKVLDARTGQPLRVIGRAGPEDGSFVRPLSIRIDNEGNLLVADVFKCRIQKFSRSGELLMAFGQSGNRAGDFVRPKHMGVGSDGSIYVVDAAFNNVQVFDENGKVAGFFGAMGNHPGAMDLPAGLWIQEADLDLFQQYIHPAFQAERLIVVSNQFGPNKVAVYAQGQLKPGKTLADISAGRAMTAVGLEDPKKSSTTRPITIGTPLPAGFGPATAPATQPVPATGR